MVSYLIRLCLISLTFQFTNSDAGFFNPAGNDTFNSRRGGDNSMRQGEPRKKNIFTPVTCKIIAEASVGPDDYIELDG